jgi:hypothetical protein
LDCNEYPNINKPTNNTIHQHLTIKIVHNIPKTAAQIADTVWIVLSMVVDLNLGADATNISDAQVRNDRNWNIDPLLNSNHAGINKPAIKNTDTQNKLPSPFFCSLYK